MKGQAHRVRWIEAKNTGNVAVPAFGVCELENAELANPGRLVLHVKRPTADGVLPIAINSWQPIPPGGYGLATIDGPIFALYDEDNYTAAFGETWGAQEDSFEAMQGTPGLLVLGAIDTGRDIMLVDFTNGLELVGGCLVNNHPGRGVAFDIYLGVWDSGDNKWTFGNDQVKAIDWRYDVPYPDAGSQGLFQARPSDEYGVIYECVSLDCDTPGSCGS